MRASSAPLVVPIYRGWALLRVNAMPALLALACGGAVSIASGVGLATFAGLPPQLVAPFYAKSVNAPIAMGVAETIGASPTLTAVYAECTGIPGAIRARYVLDALVIPWLV